MLVKLKKKKKKKERKDREKNTPSYLSASRMLKLVTKGNNSDVMEVPELGSRLHTWLQLMCCALAH